jgi:hypothetical protein
MPLNQKQISLLLDAFELPNIHFTSLSSLRDGRTW